MPDLSFFVNGAEPVKYAAAPLLALKLRIVNSDPREQIQSIIMQCQVQIEAPRRHYNAGEQSRLLDLFGEPDQWSRTLRSALWTHANVNVRSFRDSITVDLPLPCTFDFNIAATKYFHALDSGEAPLNLLFSGTVFYKDPERGLQVARIPWEKEARFRLPVEVWKGVIDAYYPNTGWLTLRRDVLERLYEYKVLHAISSWEETIERLLQEVAAGSAA